MFKPTVLKKQARERRRLRRKYDKWARRYDNGGTSWWTEDECKKMMTFYRDLLQKINDL